MLKVGRVLEQDDDKSGNERTASLLGSASGRRL